MNHCRYIFDMRHMWRTSIKIRLLQSIVVLRKLDICKMKIVLAVRKRTIKHGTNHFGIPSLVEGKYTNGIASPSTTDYKFYSENSIVY